MVMSAFANYRQGNYDEAINSGKRYVQLYPSTPDAAYAQYIVGLAYFRQIRDVTQDQKESRRAIEAMDEVVQRWPDSEYVDDAQGQDPLRARPARRQGDADRPLLSRAARVYRRDQAFPLRGRELFEHPPRRGGAGASRPRPITRWA
jgi:tetratricopeptide (TPR) repeat protein